MNAKVLCPCLGCLLAGCLLFSLHGVHNIEATSLTFGLVQKSARLC